VDGLDNEGILQRVEGNTLAVAIASGLKGNSPDFSEPAFTLLMEKAAQIGP